MPASVISIGTKTRDDTGQTGHNVAIQTHLENDILLGIIVNSQTGEAAAASYVWPAGWQEFVDFQVDAATAVRLTIAWHLAASDDEITTVQATASAAAGYGSFCAVIRDAHPTNPIDVSAEGATQGNALSNTTPSVVTTEDDVLVIRLVAIDDNNAENFNDPTPGGYNLRLLDDPISEFIVNDPGNGIVLSWHDLVEAIAGATGTELVTWTTDSEENRSFVFGIRNAPADGQIMGSIDLSLVATANISAVVPIAGEIPLTLTPIGALSQVVPISGSADLALTADGVLAATGAPIEVWYKQTKFAVPASGDTVIDVTDKGDTPFAVHITWGINTLNQFRQDDQTFGHGFAAKGTPDTYRAIMHNTEQNASNNHRASTDTATILLKNPADDVILVAAIVTFQAGSVTIVYSIQTAGFRFQIDIFGGVDGAAVVGDVGADDGAITGLGLANGDLLMMSTSGEQIPASSQFAFQSYGVSHDNGTTIDQWAVLAYAGDNDFDFKGSALVEGIIAGQYDVDFANWTINILTQSGDGATWAGSNVDHIAFLMLDLGGAGVDVGVFTKSIAAAPATQALPDLGFTPQGYGLATCSEILQTIDVDRPCRQSYGAFDGDGAAGLTGRSVISTTLNQGNVDSYSFRDDESVLMTAQTLDAPGGVPDARAKASSIMNSTPEIVWNPNTTRADFIGYWALAQKAQVNALVGTVPLTITPTAAIRADAEIAGTIPLTLAPAGTIRGIGDLAGAIPLAITPAAAIRGIGALAGTSDLVIDATGNLVAVQALAGTIPLILTPAGTLAGLGDLAGAVDLVITPAAAIQARGDLAGAVALAITATGTMEAKAMADGTISLTITPAGTIVGLGALAGSAALVLTPSAIIQARGELAGSAALVITPTGDLRAIGPLAGTIPLTLTPAGTLVGLGELAGSIALVLDAAGTLQALGELSGSSALLLTPAGTLGARGELAGSVAMILTPTGTLQANGELIGSLTLLIDATGNLAAVGGNLQGTIPLTLTATGTLQALAALSGAASLTITPSGTIQATGGLLGAATLTFTLAGDLVGLGELLGSADLVLTPTGIIAGLGELAGSSDLVLTPAGNLVGLGELSGSSDLVFDATAILQGMQQISGSIPLTITPSGTLEGVGAIQGTAALVFDATGNVQSIGTLAGAIPLTLTAAAAILARGFLAGSLTLTLTAAGTIVGEGTLAGGVAIVFTPTGSIAGGGAISGTVDLTIDAAGNMVAKALAAGSIDMAITAAGILTGGGAVSGTAQLTLSADGTLRAIGDLAGLAELAFTLAGTIFDQSARRIPNSFQSFLLFLENTRQNLAAGTDNSGQGVEAGEINSSQSITAGRTNSEQ